MDALSSLDKAIDLLFALHRAPGARGASELGRALGMPKSSVHRLLATLARRGLVERDDAGRYQPGIGLVALGLGALERDPLAAVARTALESEARALDETVFLTAVRAGAIVVLDQALGTGVLRAAPRVGSAVPVHATAVGKLYLAFAPGAVETGAEPFEAFTPSTPRTWAALAAGVERARAQGFAENRGEWIAGLVVIAAPLFAGGRMVGALAVAAPEARAEPLGRAGAPARLVAAAQQVGARLDGVVPERAARAGGMA